MTRRFGRLTALTLAALVGSGCNAAETPQSVQGEPTAVLAKVKLKVTTPRARTATRRTRMVVRGRVTRGARVTVKGERARVRKGRFRVRVALKRGTNRIRVVARKSGRRTARTTIVVRRRAKAQAERCHPSYEGACLDPGSPDYDCEGGSGNGPDYTGPVRVVGDDEYGLDSDGDGRGCES